MSAIDPYHKLVVFAVSVDRDDVMLMLTTKMVTMVMEIFDGNGFGGGENDVEGDDDGGVDGNGGGGDDNDHFRCSCVSLFCSCALSPCIIRQVFRSIS